MLLFLCGFQSIDIEHRVKYDLACKYIENVAISKNIEFEIVNKKLEYDDFVTWFILKCYDTYGYYYEVQVGEDGKINHLYSEGYSEFPYDFTEIIKDEEDM